MILWIHSIVSILDTVYHPVLIGIYLDFKIYSLKGGDRPCLGRREGYVQRRHQEAPAGELRRAAQSETDESEHGPADAADCTVAADRRLPGNRSAHVARRNGFHLPQAIGFHHVFVSSVAKEVSDTFPSGKSVLFRGQKLSVRFQASAAYSGRNGSKGGRAER